MLNSCICYKIFLKKVAFIKIVLLHLQHQATTTTKILLMTTPRELATMAKKLPYGAKSDIAEMMECDPSKVSKALRGYVKEENFMIKLERQIKAMLSGVDSVTAS